MNKTKRAGVIGELSAMAWTNLAQSLSIPSPSFSLSLSVQSRSLPFHSLTFSLLWLPSTEIQQQL